jgi:hypothetical protein
MKLPAADGAMLELIVRDLAVMQVRLDAMRARIPANAAGAEARLLFAIAIVNLERTEGTLKELQT